MFSTECISNKYVECDCALRAVPGTADEQRWRFPELTTQLAFPCAPLFLCSCCFCLFLGLCFNCNIPLLPLPPLSPRFPSNSWLLFISCYCMHISICINIYILRHNLLNLYNVTCMYMFRDDCLALGASLSPLPWRRPLLPLPAYTVVRRSLCRAEDFPQPISTSVSS